MTSSPSFQIAVTRGNVGNVQFSLITTTYRTIRPITKFDDRGTSATERAQRETNRRRAESAAEWAIACYKAGKPYMFPSLTLAIHVPVGVEAPVFEPVAVSYENIGILHFPIDCRCFVTDGQHRLLAIEIILERCPEMANEMGFYAGTPDFSDCEITLD
ncbi:DNA sulfur modification protein DndB [Vibrio sp. B181a]|uniref:DNA sulfur modification protein DndB n=1 Tax=Vibrio sp. B181a TaxID=2835906 RepID=UPI0025534DA3|nr:DNA sulfur modification protein DndB [Vibrio sp. B181a]MDK9774690.1 DGQHR domain-containing protein [Vibrio sp. B181a]